MITPSYGHHKTIKNQQFNVKHRIPTLLVTIQLTLRYFMSGITTTDLITVGTDRIKDLMCGKIAASVASGFRIDNFPAFYSEFDRLFI